MEHSTQRRSQFELSHTLMTPPAACHHGCYPTQWAHSLRPCILKRKTFQQQKILFNNFTKQLMFVTYTVCQFLLFCPTKAHRCFWSLDSTTSYWKSASPLPLPASLCEIVFTRHYWNNLNLKIMVHFLFFCVWSPTRVLAQMTVLHHTAMIHISYVLGHFSMQHWLGHSHFCITVNKFLVKTLL